MNPARGAQFPAPAQNRRSSSLNQAEVEETRNYSREIRRSQRGGFEERDAVVLQRGDLAQRVAGPVLRRLVLTRGGVEHDEFSYGTPSSSRSQRGRVARVRGAK